MARLIFLLLLLSRPAVGADFDLMAFYRHLHQNPELSFHEEKTAATLAAQLRTFGYEVTTGVGGHGVVAVLRNGEGPTVMRRMDTDAMPVQTVSSKSERVWLLRINCVQ